MSKETEEEEKKLMNLADLCTFGWYHDAVKDPLNRANPSFCLSCPSYYPQKITAKYLSDPYEEIWEKKNIKNQFDSQEIEQMNTRKKTIWKTRADRKDGALYGFGSSICKSNTNLIYNWDIQIMRERDVTDTRPDSSYIGISSYDGNIDDYEFGTVRREYAFSSVSRTKDIRLTGNSRNKGLRYRLKDIVKIKLDCNKGLVTFVIMDKNGQYREKRRAFVKKSMKTSYRLLVIMHTDECYKIKDYWIQQPKK